MKPSTSDGFTGILFSATDLAGGISRAGAAFETGADGGASNERDAGVLLETSEGFEVGAAVCCDSEF